MESVASLANEVAALKRDLAEMQKNAPISVTIESVFPDSYEVTAPIKVIVRRQNDSFVATFFDANVNASGDTDVEAVQYLKDMLVASCEMLFDHDDAGLGAEMLRKKRVLERYMRPSIE